MSVFAAEIKRVRAVGKAVRTPLRVLLGAATVSALLLISVPLAQADSTICETGSAAGQCLQPQGVAVDNETGRLYVTDRGNNRIDVFEADGTFVRAFGWGVDTKAAKLETCTTASTCQAGIAGSGPGQFDKPTWIAVDNNIGSPAHHDVYVGTDNFRVQRFSPEGSLRELSAGKFSFGGQGSGACQFNNSDRFYRSDPIAVGPEGWVYVADSYETAPNAFTSRVERFDSEGNCLGEVELSNGVPARVVTLAVDSTGSLYVTAADDSKGGVQLRKYSPSGTLLYELGGDDSAAEAQAVAVDGEDNLFTKQRSHRVGDDSEVTNFITEYDVSGDIVRRFGYVAHGGKNLLVPGLAPFHNAVGDIFASLGELTQTTEVKHLAFPPPGPVVLPVPCEVKAGTLGNISATLLAEVNPEGKPTTAHFEYVTEQHFDEEGFENPEVTDESESVGSDFDMHEATGEAALNPETTYHCRVVASNADGSATGEGGTFTSLEPLEMGPATVSDVETAAATLNVQVNPLGIPTSGFFEYVEEATYLKDLAELGPGHGFDHASKAPAGAPVEFGAGKSFVSKAVQVSGLKPGTAYRLRFIATNGYFAPGEGVSGSTEYLRTYAAGTEGLPDDRAWELVSPGQKNSAEVAVPVGRTAGIAEERALRVQASDSAGEAVTYTSFTSFGQADGAPATSQYISRRSAGGWQTENISPHGFLRLIAIPPYSGFTPDLGFGAFKILQPSLAPGCPEGFENLYLRESSSGEVHCLSNEVPKTNSKTGCAFVYAGSSEDGSRAFFASGRSYAGAPESPGFSLYEWTEAEGLQVVSVLPGQTQPALPAGATSFGAPASDFVSENCQVGLSNMRHVISMNGRTAFWTYKPDVTEKEFGEGKRATSLLLARINGEETVQLDAKVGGGKGGNGKFLAASADGSLAFFSAPGKLNSEAKGAGHLYRYDTIDRTLKDLTPGEVDAEVLGTLGASEDGSAIYFVAKGALTGEQEGPAGQRAEAGAYNLYLYREGEGLSFIAGLAGVDGPSWDSATRNLRAGTSPDGRRLAFLSIESEALADYDNTMAAGEHCEFRYNSNTLAGGRLCPQAFLFDAEAETLICASCNPTGARPLGPALVPGWPNVYQGPRYLSSDGFRLFFESYDAISSGDENGKRDIYEFELPGSGTCNVQSTAFDPRSGGCHFLVSSGRSSDESYLVDASADGRDVFFSTRSELVGWDPNSNYDIYDARIGGGFSEPSVRPDCEGRGCKAPTSAPPISRSAVTPQIQNPGNPDSSRACRKGKVRRRAKCVVSHKKQRHKHKPPSKRGTGR